MVWTLRIVNMIEEFITSVISSALVSGAVVWLSKTWISERLKNAIKNEYDQKLETHKAQLKAANDIELEKLRSSLNILAFERQIEYSKLQEKRAEVITEMYALLKDLYLAIQDYTKMFVPVGDKSTEERRKKVRDVYEPFSKCYHHKIIFLPLETSQRIAKLNRSLLDAYNNFFFNVESNPNPSEKSSNWIDVFETLQGSIAESLSDLENEFRILMGDKPSEILKEGKGE